MFEECYFEDVTSSNTFFRNCTFINTVFYNTGKVASGCQPKDWGLGEGRRRPLKLKVPWSLGVTYWLSSVIPDI